MSRLYVGTSGWVYGDWSFDYAQDKLNYFYPPKLPKRKWLEYYSGHFKTVEVNATFYHQMKPKTFENWAKTVPSDFVFAIKASRFITHVKRLKVTNSSVIQIIEPASVMGEKLGPILLQLPPRLKADAKRLADFLQMFTSEEPIGAPRRWLQGLLRGGKMRLKMAFEFRDPSWFNESIYQVLRKYKGALVIAESGGYWPNDEVVTADFTYIRFHGEGGSYASKYTDEELRVWAKKIRRWQKSGIEVYAYFNNDVSAFAVDNAETLDQLCGRI